MLKKLGYDTKSDTPTYGSPDQLVVDNMNKLKENAEFWDMKAKIYARRPPNDTNILKNQSNNQLI